MLQDMQKKVTEEGEKDKALFDKFMCYCKTSGGDLSSSIEEAKNKIESLTSSLAEKTEKKGQTDSDLKDHQAGRQEAKEALAKASALRQKEATDFSKEDSDATMNIAALAKAITALEKGVVGSFLQTADANALRNFAIYKAEIPDSVRQELMSFLSSKQQAGYVPQSGEIIGILKQLKDEMTASLDQATIDENTAQKNYEALVAAKKKEVATLSAKIEEKLQRSGALGVEIASTSNDLEDTKESLGEDTKFLAELDAGCETKEKEWEVVKQTRADELVALAETIKVLNDDDALELFKKTLPSASASFAQIMINEASMRTTALATIRAATQHSSGGLLQARPELGLIALALDGKKAGFEKVISMIDSMVKNLHTEQKDDDSKKEYCDSQFDATDDKKKGLELSISDSSTAIDEMKGSIATLAEEIEALKSVVKALDKSVAEATALRKSEHEEYSQLMTNDATAKEVLAWAKNRLNKFYNPKLYKAPPKRELSREERITVSFGGVVTTPAPGGIADTGIGASFLQIRKDAPPPPPETFTAYSTKSAESNGVIAMIDLLVKDLDKEMQEADVTEKDAQKDYEQMMAEAAKKRAGDSKSITDKSAAKAAEEESLQAEMDQKAGTSKELATTLEYIHSLHGECDWLLQYFQARKEARASEIDALGKAKAVLSGADYSLLETSTSKSRSLRASRK